MKYKTALVEFSNGLDKQKSIDPERRTVSLPTNLKMILSIVSLLNKCNEGDNIYVLNISQRTITIE
jgi:hypothetical protein